VISKPKIVLDARDYREIYTQLVARHTSYVPEWQAPDKSAGAALGMVAARFIGTILQRLNQAPDKNKLAFLDTLGLGLVPAQAARTPVVFELQPGAASGIAPIATAVAASPSGASGQIVFETESAVTVMAGKLAQIFSLWPGRDEYIDHTADFFAGQPIVLFDRNGLTTAPHHIYLSHHTLLALAGNVNLGVEFELSHAATDQLHIDWEYWDGKVWRGFLSTTPSCLDKSTPMLDSTEGLTGSGTVLLKADCATAQQIAVNGIQGFWLRGRLTDPLPPDPGKTLPEVDGIRLTSTVNQTLRPTLAFSPPQSAPQVFGVAVPPPPTQAFLGGAVMNEAGQPIQGAVVTISKPLSKLVDDPAFGRLPSDPTTADGRYTIPIGVPGGVAYRYTVNYAGLEISAIPTVAPTVAQPRINLTVTIVGLQPDQAFADGTKLDLSKPFYPIGVLPHPGSVFYISNAELLSKPLAKGRLYVSRTHSPQDEAAVSQTAPGTPTPPTTLPHLGFWEYWNGRMWAPLPVSSNLSGSQVDLDVTEVLDFTVPVDLEATKVNDVEALWVRFRLASGSYGYTQDVTWQAATSSPNNKFTYVVTKPPVVASVQLGYTWQYGPFHPEQVLAYNDFQYEDQTSAALWPGATFAPFKRMSDVTPALYLGFDQPPPAGDIGVYFDILEQAGDTQGPALQWEYWNGAQWRSLAVVDETAFLRIPGIVSFLAEPDSAALARFGKPLNWVRARLKEDGPPGSPEIDGIFPNAVWASQLRTLKDSALGNSIGTPNQAFLITQVPVIDGESIEVRELAGPRANVEWRILALELFNGDTSVLEDLENQLGQEGSQTDIVEGDLRLVRDRKKRVTEAWVHWRSRPWLYFSGPDDRDYAIDRALGRVLFGDGVTGRIPPAGAAILVKQMRSGGGAAGNVAENTVTQLMGVVSGIQSVFNARAAEGGSDGETLAASIERAPRTVRHRGRAISPADFETMAKEASAAVAVAHAVPTCDSSGRPRAGWVTLIVIPHSQEDRPYPSFGLRDEVKKYIAARAAAGLAASGQIYVTGPEYFPVDIAATLAPVVPAEAGLVEQRAHDALAEFFHPLFGGPGGTGWDLGRSVFLSDVAAVLEGVAGVDFVEELSLMLNGAPQGDRIRVPAHSIVVGGTFTLKLTVASR
jgi:hypothetical protein